MTEARYNVMQMFVNGMAVLPMDSAGTKLTPAHLRLCIAGLAAEQHIDQRRYDDYFDTPLWCLARVTQQVTKSGRLVFLPDDFTIGHDFHSSASFYSLRDAQEHMLLHGFEFLEKPRPVCRKCNRFEATRAVFSHPAGREVLAYCEPCAVSVRI